MLRPDNTLVMQRTADKFTAGLDVDSPNFADHEGIYDDSDIKVAMKTKDIDGAFASNFSASSKDLMKANDSPTSDKDGKDDSIVDAVIRKTSSNNDF